MKTIIAGSRSISSFQLVSKVIVESGFQITEVVSGHAIGVDYQGERFAREKKIPVKLFIPDWKKHGKRAGFIRNAQMAEYADALIAIWDGKSKGTENMISNAKQRNLKVFIYNA